MPSPASRPARASKPPSHGRLVGKVAIVTGAASGIGAACARLFAAEGAAVLCTDLDADAGATAMAILGRDLSEAEFALMPLERCIYVFQDSHKNQENESSSAQPIRYRNYQTE